MNHRRPLTILNSANLEEMKNQVQSLLAQCQVIRSGMISSIGLPGKVGFPRSGHTEDLELGEADLDWVPTQSVIGATGLECLITPNTRIQFASCQQACREESVNWAERIGQGLQQDLLGRSRLFQVPGNLQPFQGSRFLFNTHVTDIYEPAANFTLTHHRNWSIADEGNLGIMYTVGRDRVTSDVPVQEAPQCE